MQSPARALNRNKKLLQALACVAVIELLLILWFLHYDQTSTNLPAPSPSQQRFITVEFTQQRRIGNLLFDYASLQGIAHAHNMTPVMPSFFPALDMFDLKVKVVDDVYQQLGMWKRFREKYASKYDDRVMDNLPEQPYHIVLNGFYQSWKYFEPIEKELRTHFRFRPYIEREAEQFLHQTSVTGDSGVYTRVGIHVRRGDILTASDIILKGYSTPSEQYYHNAMNYFRSRHKLLQFVVVTDSPDWTQENLAGENVVHSLAHSVGVDLAILALCDHVIISVGTFGWWGAWLANGITVYYDKWPQRNSFLARQVETKDYFPPHWMPMH